MSKKVVMKTVLLFTSLTAGSLFALFGTMRIVPLLSDRSDRYINQQSIKAAVRIQKAKERCDTILQNVSPDKEITLIINRGNAGTISVKVSTDDVNAKEILREFIQDDSIQDIVVQEKNTTFDAPMLSQQTAGQIQGKKVKKQPKKVYHIQKGDTLSAISDKLLYSVDELAKYNQIKDVNLIYAGSSLRIPQKSNKVHKKAD